MTFIFISIPLLALPYTAESDEESEMLDSNEYVNSDTINPEDSSYAEVAVDSSESYIPPTGGQLAEIKMTDNANKFIQNTKDLTYNKYGPYGKLEKVNTSKKISLDKDFKIPNLDISSYIIKFIVILVIVLFIILIITNFYWRFGKSGKDKNKTSDDDEESIYNRKFQTELQKLLQAKNYKEAIKVVYLETLYNLNEKGLIKWELAKTPAEYYYEIKNKNIKTDFLSMTSIFLSVRYGNEMADEEMFQKVSEERNNIFKISSQLATRK
ncbi:MAG TPA: hypothetical protein PLY22_06305 [Fervidobacterium sp.]|nr:hypothetical protein [Fervidobacterium sp.]